MAYQRFLTSIITRPNSYTKGVGYVPMLIGVLFIAFALSGCARPATFRVLDSESNEPIEGAVALATWTDSKGLPGLSYTHTAKAIEMVTDSDGIFQIPMIVGILALQKPHLKVYKAGYVGWDSRWIYLGPYEADRTMSREVRRSNFSMEDQDLFLEPWQDQYSFMSHSKFIASHANLHQGGLTESKYYKAIRYEVPFCIKERKAFREKRK